MDDCRMTVGDLLTHWSKVETWRKIEDFPNYEISSWGNVKGPRGCLQNVQSTGGYLFVSLSQESTVTNKRVHRLVAKAFLGDSVFAGTDVLHADGDTTNNNIINLRYGTALDNQIDVTLHGNRKKGCEVFGSKLDNEKVLMIHKLAHSGERYQDIADKFSVSISTVSLIKLRKIWKHVLSS